MCWITRSGLPIDVASGLTVLNTGARAGRIDERAAVTEACKTRGGRRSLLAALVVVLAMSGAGWVYGAVSKRPVTSLESLTNQAEGRGNVKCVYPAAPDVTGALSVSCFDALGDPVRLVYSADAKVMEDAEAALVNTGWSIAGNGNVRIGVQGALAQSIAQGIASAVS